MTKPRTPYQASLPLDAADDQPTSPDQRKALHAKLRRALATGDTAAATLLIQFSILQTLERMEKQLELMSDQLDRLMDRRS